MWRHADINASIEGTVTGEDHWAREAQ